MAIQVNSYVPCLSQLFGIVSFLRSIGPLSRIFQAAGVWYDKKSSKGLHWIEGMPLSLKETGLLTNSPGVEGAGVSVLY